MVLLSYKMSNIDIQWTKIIIVWFCMTGHTYSASIKKDITCYVCSPSQISDNILEQELYIFSSVEIDRIPICGSITASNFTLKCPKDYHGCVTKFYGEKIIFKSCNALFITDCKIANGIKYCFCADNLCNRDATVLIPIPTTTDDEDLDQSTDDGSGSFDWEQYKQHDHSRNQFNTFNVKKNNELNNTSRENENDSFTKASALNLFHFRSVNVLSLVFLIYRVV